nr:MAG TPA: hypothetical protein [Caudoviricetes sp.]
MSTEGNGCLINFYQFNPRWRVFFFVLVNRGCTLHKMCIL